MPVRKSALRSKHRPTALKPRGRRLDGQGTKDPNSNRATAARGPSFKGKTAEVASTPVGLGRSGAPNPRCLSLLLHRLFTCGALFVLLGRRLVWRRRGGVLVTLATTAGR